MSNAILTSLSFSNPIDILIGLGLLWGAINGFRKGLVLEVIALIGIFVSLYFAFHYSYKVEYFLHKNIETDESTGRIMAFAVSFLIAFICLKIIGTLLTRLLKVFALGLLNRFLGALLGVVKAVLLATALLLLLSSTKWKGDVLTPKVTATSFFYSPLSHLGHRLFPLLKENLAEHDIHLPPQS